MEAFQASATTLRLCFKSFDAAKPSIVVVVCIHYLQSETLGISCALIFALQIFLKGVDIGIAVEDSGAYAVLEQTFHYCGRARGTTGMEENFAFSARDFYFEFLLSHIRKCRCLRGRTGRASLLSICNLIKHYELSIMH